MSIKGNFVSNEVYQLSIYLINFFGSILLLCWARVLEAGVQVHDAGGLSAAPDPVARLPV